LPDRKGIENQDMKITDLLNPAAIAPELQATGKSDVLGELTDAMLKVENNLDRQEVIKVLQERERLGSTGIGDGVAIPHGKLKDIKKLLISFGRSRSGVDFDSMDGKPAHLFFLLVAPEESVGVHLKTLARISKLLKNPAVRRRLMEASNGQDLYQIIAEEEEKL
jgi:PTS system nitrogen regulatory IIA component